MSDYYPVIYYPPPPESPCTTVVQVAALGAVVGGAGAAGSAIWQVRNNGMDAGEALMNTGRGILAGAVGAAVAGAAASLIEDQGLLRLGVMFGVGAAAMYGMESAWARNRQLKDDE